MEWSLKGLSRKSSSNCRRRLESASATAMALPICCTVCSCCALVARANGTRAGALNGDVGASPELHAKDISTANPTPRVDTTFVIAAPMPSRSNRVGTRPRDHDSCAANVPCEAEGPARRTPGLLSDVLTKHAGRAEILAGDEARHESSRCAGIVVAMASPTTDAAGLAVRRHIRWRIRLNGSQRACSKAALQL